MPESPIRDFQAVRIEYENLGRLVEISQTSCGPHPAITTERSEDGEVMVEVAIDWKDHGTRGKNGDWLTRDNFGRCRIHPADTFFVPPA